MSSLMRVRITLPVPRQAPNIGDSSHGSIRVKYVNLRISANLTTGYQEFMTGKKLWAWP